MVLTGEIGRALLTGEVGGGRRNSGGSRDSGGGGVAGRGVFDSKAHDVSTQSITTLLLRAQLTSLVRSSL